MDHVGRHEVAWATPATAALYKHRLGPRMRVRETPYGEPWTMGPVRLTALPAGHCLGSALLLAELDDQRLLYTGDFRLRPSLTAEPATLPQADTLVIESTFGHPRFQFPDRGDVETQLLELIQATVKEGRTPVIHAYALGKAQEVAALLVRHGRPVQQHPVIYATSRVYEACGVKLGVKPYAGRPEEGHVVMTLPRGQRGWRLGGLGETVSIALTGWAIDARTRTRLGVDHALPFSDHADFNELLETVERVAPRRIYVTHGPRGFVDQLLARGHDARPLAPEPQKRLF
ncbi:Ribonuclease [Pirellulimonas nuda]|uniref:Ribonuclease n=2 Tax=Pirellulimonas nuda TaxID=2528009 RepID=A0A518DIW0_9BACT|nr:Ribonuclease [Pirellulimonas nuda]